MLCVLPVVAWEEGEGEEGEGWIGVSCCNANRCPEWGYDEEDVGDLDPDGINEDDEEGEGDEDGEEKGE